MNWTYHGQGRLGVIPLRRSLAVVMVVLHLNVGVGAARVERGSAGDKAGTLRSNLEVESS